MLSVGLRQTEGTFLGGAHFRICLAREKEG